MADVELLPCGECGMPCRAGEYHPFAACLMFKACHNSETVRANLAPLQAENERLRAEVEDYRTNGAAAVRFAPNSAHWSTELRRLFGDDARAGIEVLENGHRQELARAERLAEALREARDCAESHLGLLIADNMSGGVEQTKALITKIDAALAQEDRNG